MTEATSPANPPAPLQDMSGYRDVLINKTDEVDGHVYKRGDRATVDSATLAELQKRDMIYGDPKPAT